MRAFIFLGLLLLLFGSCTPEKKVIYIKFEHSQGLHAKHQLILKGVKVGEVINVDLTSDYKVVASVRILDSVKLPNDSQFTIGNTDLFTKAIIVEEGKSKVFLQRGDTVQGAITVDLLKNFDFQDSNPLEGLNKLLQN